MSATAYGAFPDRLAGLLRPEAYPHPVSRVKLVTTQLSWVLLAGEHAYKIKRPVRYPFVDFSTLERRAYYCAEELRISSRFAPALYERLATVTLADGKARIDGAGEVIDHAVVMHAFGQGDLLAARVADRSVVASELAAFGTRLARLHASLPMPAAGSLAGASATVAAGIGRNLAECLAATSVFGNQAEVAMLAERLRATLARQQGLIDARRRAGRVRETHGDLHMGNLVRHEGALLAFDALEFEPGFRWADVTQDVAFLHADLQSAGRPDLAQAFLDGYLRRSGDYAMLPLFGLYVADRALVRAKVMAILGQESPTAHALHESRQQAYLQVASAALAPGQALCVMMHGPSGSGKSWLAARLAARLPALVVRSDIERHRLASAAARRGTQVLPYSPESVRATYVRLRRCAQEALASGLHVILDATYLKRAERGRLRELCRQLGTPLVVIDCQATADVLAQRVAQRQQRGDDASEAGPSVLLQQQSDSEPLLPEEALDCIVADTTRPGHERSVLQALRQRVPAPPGDQPSGTAPGLVLRSA